MSAAPAGAQTQEVKWGQPLRKLNYRTTANNRTANSSLEREEAEISRVMAQAQLHIAQAETARANGESEVANAPLVRDLLRIVREREKEEEAQIEDIDELEYINIMRTGTDPNVAKVGELISFVASFAAEDPHDLISTWAKSEVVLGSRMTDNKPWNYYVSDKLEAHTVEVASIIRDHYPLTLGDTTTEDFVHAGDEAVRIRFHRAVASMYRGSSVFAVKRYSTTKAIDTLQSTIAQHIRFFSNVRVEGGKLKVSRKRQLSLPRELYGI
tara:strand:+ start:468 stop:1274 length:807 start_codon:yes stop_codon:yes gene_type:complete